MNALHTARGFTLIEVMIAILIMSLISVISWRALETVQRSDTQLQTRAEESAQVLRALQQIERDVTLRATVELPGFEPAGVESAEEAASREDAAAAEPAAGAPRAAVSRDSRVPLLPASLLTRRTPQRPFELEIIRAAPVQPGHWQRVQWWAVDGTLYRAAGPSSARFPLMAPARSDAIAVLNGIATFEARAWQASAGWTQLPHNRAVDFASTGIELVLSRPGGTDAARLRRVIALD